MGALSASLGRLIGVYVAAFFVVGQAVAPVFFPGRLQLPTILGGAWILIGRILITVRPVL